LPLAGLIAGTRFERFRKTYRSSALAQSQADLLRRHLAAIVDSSDDAIIGKNQSGVITSWNSGAEKMFGYSAQEAIGQPTTFFMDLGVANEEFDIHAKIRTDVDHYETRGRRKDGTEVFVSVSVSPIKDASGKMIGSSKIARDITERRRNEEITARQAKELLTQTTLLQNVFRHSPTAIAVLGGPEFTFEMVNPAYQAFQPGIPMIGKTVAELWHDAAPIVLPLLRRVRDTRLPYHAIAMPIPRRRSPDEQVEERFFTFSYVPLRDLDVSDEPKILVVAQDVTDMKRIELGLREKAKLLDLSNDAILVRNAQDLIGYWSTGAVEAYGYTPDEALGHSVHELLRTKFPQPLSAVSETLRRRGRWTGELVHTRKDGTEITVSSRWAADRDAQGNIRAILETNSDVTERKKAELKLREIYKQNEFLAGLIRNSSQAVAVGTPDARLTLVNPAFEQLTGYSAEELYSMNWATDLTPPEWQESERENLAKMHRTGVPVRYEKEYIRKDRTRIPIELLAHEGTDANGDLQLYYAFVTDISGRKQAEVALRLAKEQAERDEAQLRTVYENMSDRLYVCDGKGNVIFANEAIRRSYITNDASVPPHISDLQDEIEVFDLNGERLPFEQWPIARVVRGESIRSAEIQVRFRRTGKEVILSSSGGPVRDESGNIVMSVLTSADITDSKKTEEALQQSLERLKKVLEVETVGVMFWDLNTGCLVDANDTFLKLMGYSRGEVDTHELTWQRFTPPEYMDVSRREVMKFMATGRVGPYEKEYFRKDGSRQWLLFAGSSLGGNQCVEFCVDISDRKEVEEALRRAAEFDEAAMKSIGEGLITIDNDGAVTSMNPAAEELLGWTLIEMRGRKLHDAIHHHHPDGRPFPSSECAGFQVLGHGRPLKNYEDVFIRKDGKFFDVTFSNAPLRDAAGRITGLVYVFSDLSERKRAEKAVRSSEEQFRTLANAIPNLCWMANADGWITWYNERWYEYTGTTPQEMEGWGWQSVHDSRTLPAVIERWKESLAEGKPFEMVFPLRGTDGVFRPFLTLVVPVYDSDGKVVRWFGTNTDVSELEETTKALREREEQLRLFSADLERRVQQRTTELTSANKELESFTYSVSHDLRAPLRGIDGWSAALIEDYGNKLDEQAHEYLGRVRSETQRMGQLIDDLLRLSRVTRAEMKPTRVDLSALATTITSRIREANPERNTEFAIEPGLTGEGDPRLLEIALTNLLDNAAKFSSKRKDAKVEFGATNHSDLGNKKTQFFVRDNGAGFDMTYASQLFGAFQRLHTANEFAGTGIGLATVQRVILRHGGTISAESKPNEGATFYFTIGGAN